MKASARCQVGAPARTEIEPCTSESAGAPRSVRQPSMVPEGVALEDSARMKGLGSSKSANANYSHLR